MDEAKFREKISMLTDPYFDREFFTNLIYCWDRKKTLRDHFVGVLEDVVVNSTWNDELDRSLLQMFYAYEASSLMRENYQWLPFCQGLYTLALNRSNGQKPSGLKVLQPTEPQAVALADFEALVRRQVRGVESCETVWSHLLFLLENRSTRSHAAGIMVREALHGSDALTWNLLVKGFQLALASGWKNNEAILHRPFRRFWKAPQSDDVAVRGLRLAESHPGALTNTSSPGEWQSAWSEELWNRGTRHSPESVWEAALSIHQQGANLDQINQALVALRGRLLWTMKAEQWPVVAESLLIGEALVETSQWLPAERKLLLAMNIVEFVTSAQRVSQVFPLRPTGQNVLDGSSKNISKDRLVLRLDDACERGDRGAALEILAAILKDQGLSHSVSDRLLLMAAKQDGWTYRQLTLPVAMVVTRCYQACARMQMGGQGITDSLFGILRWLSDQRQNSKQVVARTGTYGDGLNLSQFDVSGGARIVDRFVFNQLRNAQRIKVWPSDN